MRSVLIAALLCDPGMKTDISDVFSVADRWTQAFGYSVHTEAIPRDYPRADWEVVEMKLAATGPFALLETDHRQRPARWALRLAAEQPDLPVLLNLGPELDRLPGVGIIAREGPNQGPALKIYLGGAPLLKVGGILDDEVAYPIPELVPERLAVVIEPLCSVLGALATPLKAALRRGLAAGNLQPKTVLAALKLPSKMPEGARTRRYLHHDSPLTRHF